MCKYCKNLKRIKDLEEKELKRIIKNWKRRDQKARFLLNKCLLVLADIEFSFIGYGCGGSFDSLNDQFLIKQINDFLNQDYVGK